MMSVWKLKLQDVAAESLIAAGVQRMNQNNGEHFSSCWRKYRQKITFLTHLETFPTLIKMALEIYNTLESATMERDLKMFMFYLREKRVKILQW